MQLDESREPSPLVISVVVPVYNKKSFLEASLCSIMDAADISDGVSVTIVDHGSTDGSQELGAALSAGRARHLVRAGGTIGALRNVGARESDGQIISFIDCDCLVPLGYFSSLRRVMMNPHVTATGCRVDYPTDASWIERVWHELHRADPTEGFRSYLNSGNFAVRRSAFMSIGGFSESLVTGEDAEIGQRLNAQGHKIWESRELAVLHMDNPQTLGAFFRKEVWHSLGMFGTVRAWPPDKPTVMTFLHLAGLIVAGWLLVTGPFEIAERFAAAVVLSFGVPALAVGYRAISMRRRLSWPQSLVLYQAYFLARITALGVLARNRIGWLISGEKCQAQRA